MDTGITLNPQRRAALVASGAWQDQTLLDYLDTTVARTPDRPAIIGYRVGDDTRTELSYRDLDQTVTRMAAGLAALGIQPGDVVACQLPNWWQTTALHLACLRIGAILNPLMPIFRERELRFMLAHGEARLLVIPKLFRGFDYEAMIDGIRAELPRLETLLVIGGDGERSFEQRLLDTPWEDTTDTQTLFSQRRPGRRRRHPDSLHLGHHRRAQGGHAHLQHPVRQRPPLRRAAPPDAGRHRADGVAGRPPDRLHVRAS